MSTTLVYLLPLLLLLVPLLAGRYPGERLLARAMRRRRPRSPRVVGSPHAPLRTRRPHAIGLLSCGLAGRAPPARVVLT